jgi:predicted transcriptional regulator
MNANIPSAQEVRAKLQALSPTTLEALAQRSKVPLSTLVKIKYGQTDNPRIDTVRAIWPELIGTEGAPEVSKAEEAGDAG